MSRATAVGVAILVVGLAIVALGVATFPTMLFGGCTEVGTPGEHEGSVGIVGVEDGRVLYTPDGGVNECSIPLQFVAITVGMIGVGALRVVVSRVD